MPIRPPVTMLPMRSSNIKAAGWYRPPPPPKPKPLPLKPKPLPLKPGAPAPEEGEELEEEEVNENGMLVVMFLSGTTYKYDDVPEAIWKAFLAAPSKGKFFHKNIRMAYDYDQIG